MLGVWSHHWFCLYREIRYCFSNLWIKKKQSYFSHVLLRCQKFCNILVGACLQCVYYVTEAVKTVKVGWLYRGDLKATQIDVQLGLIKERVRTLPWRRGSNQNVYLDAMLPIIRQIWHLESIRRALSLTVQCSSSPSQPRQKHPQLSNCASRTTKILQNSWFSMKYFWVDKRMKYCFSWSDASKFALPKFLSRCFSCFESARVKYK